MNCVLLDRVYPSKKGPGPHRGTPRISRGAAFALLCLIFSGTALISPPAFAADIHAGYSALWYDPDRVGEGFVLEVRPDKLALLYWYTYDESGNQRWLQGVGEIQGSGDNAKIVFKNLYAYRGGEFGPGFDPDQVTPERVAQATMAFTGCDSGKFTYSAFDQSQTFNLVRLTHTMGAVGCWPYRGVPGKPVKAYAGQSGSWYDGALETREGFSLQWLSRNQAIITWFTYDAQGNPYWMIGVGHYADGKIVFESLDAPSGARFGAAFDPADVQHIDWGSLTLTLECATGTAHYESDLPAFGAGNFDLTRLTYLKRPACPYVKPKLSELYEVTWTEISIETGTPLDPVNIQAQSIADNGTVVAASHRGPLLWRSGAEEWQVLHQRVAGTPLLISPDGSQVVATGPIADFGEPIYPLIWSIDNSWKRLSNLAYDRSIVYGVSQDFSRIVGRGHPAGVGGSYPWIWDAEHGQQALPLTEQITGGAALAISNDGRIVVGAKRRIHDDFPYPRTDGLIWEQGSDPRFIFDDEGVALGAAALCNHDCSLIFGATQADHLPNHPHFAEAWVWIRGSGVTYLGAPNDAIDSNSAPTGVSADGSLLVGIYDADFYPRLGIFVWTQRTGMSSVDGLIDELSMGDHDWRTIMADVSSNGKFILLSGWFAATPDQNRAVILDLRRKAEMVEPY